MSEDNNDLIIEDIDTSGRDKWTAKKKHGYEQLIKIAETVEADKKDLTNNLGKDWWNIACVCAIYGEAGFQPFIKISEQNQSYEYDLALDKFTLALQKTRLVTNAKLISICRALGIDYLLDEESNAEQSLAFLPEDAYTDNYDPAYDLKVYGFVEYKNCFCMMKENGSGFALKPFTNFTLKVKYHIPDKKNPRRLIEVVNNLGVKKSIDTLTHNMGSIQKFVDLVEGLGNFQFNGGKPELSKIKMKLFDQEKHCFQIDTMGHHHDGMYVYCNGIFIYKQNEFIVTDDDGIVDLAEQSYYIPAGNKSYEHERFLYANEKKFRHTQTEVTFENWCELYYKVFRKSSCIDLCFALTCLFSDVVFETMEGFPILFLYGEGSSGKGTRMKSLQRLFGTPQDALKISEKANTDKAKIREMAQFINAICAMDEYTNDVDQKAINTLKGIWDRFGYKRAVMDSKFGTESVPINSGVIMTGNEYPIDDPLVQRIIAIEINDNKFTEEDKNIYNRLRDLTHNGITSVTLDILKHRTLFEEQYKEVFRIAYNQVAEMVNLFDVTDRMKNNVTTLVTTYKLLAPHQKFPFTEAELLHEIKVACEKQCGKRASGAVVQQFWDMVLYLLQTNRLKNGQQLEISDGYVYLKFKEVYPEYLITMSQQKQLAQKQSTLIDKLKLSDGFIGDKKSKRFPDDPASVTSCYYFDYKKLNVDLLSVITRKQEEEKKRNHNNQHPAADDTKDDLPF